MGCKHTRSGSVSMTTESVNLEQPSTSAPQPAGAAGGQGVPQLGVSATTTKQADAGLGGASGVSPSLPQSTPRSPTAWGGKEPPSGVPQLADSGILGGAILAGDDCDDDHEELDEVADLDHLPANLKLTNPEIAGALIVHSDHSVAVGALGHAVPHHEHDLATPPPLIGLVSVRGDSSRHVLQELHASTFSVQGRQASERRLRIGTQGSSRHLLNATMDDVEHDIADNKRAQHRSRKATSSTPHSVRNQVEGVDSGEGISAVASSQTAGGMRASVDDSLVITNGNNASIDNSLNITATTGSSSNSSGVLLPMGASIDQSLVMSVGGASTATTSSGAYRGGIMSSGETLAASQMTAGTMHSSGLAASQMSAATGYNSAEAHRAALIEGYPDQATAHLYGNRGDSPDHPYMQLDSVMDTGTAAYPPSALSP